MARRLERNRKEMQFTWCKLAEQQSLHAASPRPSSPGDRMHQSDIDSIIVETMSVHDGVLGFIGFDDDRPVALWSSYHADRCVVRLREARARLRVAEWALADVQARGATHCIERAAWTLNGAKADLTVWEAQAARLEAARRVDRDAPKVSPVGE